MSARLTAKGIAAFEILKARHPKKKITDLISDIFEIAAEQVEATPPINFATLDGAEYLLIKAAIATLNAGLEKFRSDLLKIDQFPDDAERTEAIVKLYESTEVKLQHGKSVADNIARIALLAKIPNGPEFHLLIKLDEKLIELEAEAADEEKPMYILARKLFNIFLP